MSPFGHHLTLDCKGCSNSIEDEQTVKDFIIAIMETIDMKPAGPCMVWLTGAHDPDLLGFTAIQIIETSSIVAHFVNNGGYAYIDVFSCKQFPPDKVMELTYQWFKPSGMKDRMTVRDAN